MAPATCFLHLHAHSSISLSIPAKDMIAYSQLSKEELAS